MEPAFEPWREPETTLEKHSKAGAGPAPAIELPPIDLPPLPEIAAPESEPEPELAETSQKQERERRVLAARITPRRSADEGSGGGRRRAEPVGEFSFEEEHGGRGVTLLVIAVVVVTVGFLVVLGPRLVARWKASRSHATEQVQAPPPSPEAPSTARPAEPDDRAAASSSGGPAGTAPSGEPAGKPASGGTAPETGDQGTKPPAGGGITGTEPKTQPPVVSPPPSAPPASKPPRPAATSAPATGWIVHVSSYRTEKTAQIEMTGLRKHGYEAGLELTDLGEKGMWYRVYAGPFATREEAETARAALLKFPEYHYAQVRRVPRD